MKRIDLSRSNGGLFADIEADLIAMLGEFCGTVMFLLFALGSVQALNTTSASPTGDYYYCAGFGLSLFAVSSVFYRFTGSIFNPSVSLALALTGVIGPVRFVLVAIAQMIGGIVAAALVDGLTPGPLLVGVVLGNGASRAQGLFIEMFTTAGLTLSVLMLAAEKHLMTPIAPLGFGFMLFAVMLWSAPFTGGAVNTARAFGPACIEGFQSYHWIYWLGPTLGALLAVGMYWVLKKLKYWRINPNQESTDRRDAPMQEV
ncbi:hypothetical protein EHS25_007777 [Saitozyma podzolica]|uniref:Aquaporin n=1 Tax=Saitozyma podzolica TaxID=1890683 RepID=A0A427YQQ1_9TREE|nr:hypothetical protein EHS25_007777 [Saitozyma podzolica]